LFEPADNQRPATGTPQFDTTDRKILLLKRRLIREATMAVSMLERSLEALFSLDLEAAQSVRMSDDSVDNEEVQIEQDAQPARSPSRCPRSVRRCRRARACPGPRPSANSRNECPPSATS
jgi:phosphate uptake regulator